MHIDAVLAQVNIADAESRRLTPAAAGVAQNQDQETATARGTGQARDLPMSQEHVIAAARAGERQAAGRLSPKK